MIMKGRTAQADKSGVPAKSVTKYTTSHMSAGANTHAKGKQQAAADKPRDDARQSAHDAVGPSDGLAAGEAVPAAQTASTQKHKKRRHGSKASAADAPAQQQAAAQQRANEAVTTAAADDVARQASAGAATVGGATRDPLSPEALQVVQLLIGRQPLCLFTSACVWVASIIAQHRMVCAAQCSGHLAVSHACSTAHPAKRLHTPQAHSAFFDHLVELVPARHYHDLDADRVSTKYMKRTDREAAKAAFRKQHKQVAVKTECLSGCTPHHSACWCRLPVCRCSSRPCT